MNTPSKSRRSSRKSAVTKRPALIFASAAVLVTAPRLIIAFLAADGVELPSTWRVAALALSSIATAVALTGGMAYLAHAVATAGKGRQALGVMWGAALLCSGALMTPAVVSSLRGLPMHTVLGPDLHWAYAWAAVLAVDLVAAGAMLADAWSRPSVKSRATQNKNASQKNVRRTGPVAVSA